VRRARASLGAGFEYFDGDVGDPAVVIGRQPHALRIVAADVWDAAMTTPAPTAAG
jgi:hypothetical protein